MLFADCEHVESCYQEKLQAIAITNITSTMLNDAAADESTDTISIF